MRAVIRKAREGDLKSLVEIESAAFVADRISARAFRRLVGSPSATVLVAEANGRTEGSAVMLTRRGTRAARLYSVAARRPGTGVGSALLAEVESLARRGGATRLLLEVRADNAGARRLYERLGFRVLGTRPDYYADGEAALRMEKRLSDAAPGERRGTSRP